MPSAQSATAGARAPDFDHLAWLAAAAPFGDAGLEGRALLDLGCGSGYLCAAAKRQGARHVVGIDIMPPDVAPVGWSYASLDLESEAWPEQVPRQGGAFDLICAFDILEHLSSPVRFLRHCQGLLSPQGRLVLTTPNTASWERLVKGERWSGATDPQHKILFNLYSLGFLLRRVGFAPLQIKAPMRRLEAWHLPSPPIGAQIFCLAAPVARR